MSSSACQKLGGCSLTVQQLTHEHIDMHVKVLQALFDPPYLTFTNDWAGVVAPFIDYAEKELTQYVDTSRIANAGNCRPGPDLSSQSSQHCAFVSGLLCRR